MGLWLTNLDFKAGFVDFCWVAGIVRCDGWMGGWPAVFSFFPLQHVDLCGRWSGGGWFCSNLLVVWGVSGVMVGWVLPICW